jgi:hypothetical protein
VGCDVLEVDDVLRRAIVDLVNGDEVEGLEEALGGPEAASGVLLMLLQWVEDVFWRCAEVRRDRGRLRGQVMAVAAAMAGEP